MLKTIEELRKIEGAEMAITQPKLLLTPNSNGETVGEEIDRMIASTTVYTLDDLSKEARNLLRI